MVFGVFSSFTNFISYWYFRYLLVTELYMLEIWERVVTNVAVVLFAVFLSYFNVTFVLKAASSLATHIPDVSYLLPS